MARTRRWILAATTSATAAGLAGCTGLFSDPAPPTTELRRIRYRNYLSKHHTLRIAVYSDDEQVFERTVDLPPASTTEKGNLAITGGTITERLPEERGQFEVVGTLVGPNAPESTVTDRLELPWRASEDQPCSDCTVAIQEGPALAFKTRPGCGSGTTEK
ncbi:hypothetical protein [Haloarchaeobius sp. DYHT-AS-18]|uniref:hypothetical protein n=1 Tax=Haloarchaeobius sp. DYHT-AS-18 TaxID=3446117 RepID=UPI003EB9354B